MWLILYFGKYCATVISDKNSSDKHPIDNFSSLLTIQKYGLELHDRMILLSTTESSKSFLFIFNSPLVFFPHADNVQSLDITTAFNAIFGANRLC